MSLTWADDVTVYLQFHCYLNQNIYTAHLYMNMCVWDKNVKLNLWISNIFTHHKCRKRNGASNPKHRDVTGTNSQSDSSTHTRTHTYIHTVIRIKSFLCESGVDQHRILHILSGSVQCYSLWITLECTCRDYLTSRMEGLHSMMATMIRSI